MFIAVTDQGQATYVAEAGNVIISLALVSNALTQAEESMNYLMLNVYSSLSFRDYNNERISYWLILFGVFKIGRITVFRREQIFIISVFQI